MSLYISATEAGLTEAQDFVRAMMAKEMGVAAAPIREKVSSLKTLT